MDQTSILAGDNHVLKVSIASKNQTKIEACYEFLLDYFNTGKSKDDKKTTLEFTTTEINSELLPSQPFQEGGMDSCRARLRYIKERATKPYDIFIAIENSIFVRDIPDDSDLTNITQPERFSRFTDVVNIIVEMCHLNVTQQFTGIPIILENAKAVQMMSNSGLLGDKVEGAYLGYNKTYGECLQDIGVVANKGDWMGDLKIMTRHQQICGALGNVFNKIYLYNSLGNYNDFPKPGVVFQDLGSILVKPDLTDRLLFTVLRYLELYHSVEKPFDQIDKVIMLDARGFILGAMIATQISKGMVCMRKAGKLPGDTVSTSYSIEYKDDNVFELQKDKILAGERCIVVDDILATGGTLYAAKNLIEMCGAHVVDCIVVNSVKPLEEKARKLLGDTHIEVIL